MGGRVQDEGLGGRECDSSSGTRDVYVLSPFSSDMLNLRL